MDKQKFIEALAEYLAGNQAMMSMKLQAGDKGAQLWAKMRGATPLMGYPTVPEAQAALASWLGISI